jgi:uncharacterized protein (DUF2267 family)
VRPRHVVLGVAGTVVGAWALWSRSQGGRTVGDTIEALKRQARILPGRLDGIRYRARGGHPADNVPDTVLADRIRSTIGPLERRLDVPRIHVTALGGFAILHGNVATDDERRALENGVLEVYGVRGVESHLHLGFARGDTRPSDGHDHPAASAARTRFEAALRDAGLPPDRDPVPVLRAVLGTFVDRIPAGERDQLLGHLPADVTSLAETPRRLGAARDLRTVDDLVSTAQDAAPGLAAGPVLALVRSVLTTLAELVPEERSDVGATLPAELKAFWAGLHASREPATVAAP